MSTEDRLLKQLVDKGVRREAQSLLLRVLPNTQFSNEWVEADKAKQVLGLPIFDTLIDCGLYRPGIELRDRRPLWKRFLGRGQPIYEFNPLLCAIRLKSNLDEEAN